MINKKNILITGGTGSFGKVFVSHMVSKYKNSKIFVYSRDEMKQWEMSNDVSSDQVKFIIGDVRDREKLHKSIYNMDYVVHAAATKIVPTSESNPEECIKTNILGAMNVIEASINHKVKKVIALSTDKACNPINLYGATKLCSDKLFIAANQYAGKPNKQQMIFSVVRYGNVMGSRGSIIPFFNEIKKTGVLPITDKRMTRFMITLEEGVKLVWKAFEDMVGGEIYVKKIPSMKIIDIADSISPGCKKKFIGIRPGEKLHEQMIGIEDSPYTYEYKDFYKILPQINNWDQDIERIKDGVKVPNNFVYSSDTNSWWMDRLELIDWIKNNLNNNDCHDSIR